MAKEVKKDLKPIDILDVLLDQDNREPIVLMDDKGKQLTFEQVAVIPYEVRKEKRLYAVLKPLDKIEGIGEDEAIVFYVDSDEEGNSIIKVEEDEEVAIAVFDKYYDLLEEAQKEEKAAKKTTKPKATGKTAGKTTTKAPAAKTTTKTTTAAKKKTTK